MKWYFTPDLGNYGAAVEMDEYGNLHRIGFAIPAENGGIAFAKWAPPMAGMCSPKSYQVALMTLYETNEEQAEALKQLFSTKIVRNVNGSGPRLIQ